MKRLSFAPAALLAAISCAHANTYKDSSGTISQGTVDVSRTSGAHVQCVLTVTTTATPLASLWATAGCPVSLPYAPQFAWVGGYGGGAFFYSTDGAAPVAALTAGTSSYPVAAGQSWPIEGPLSVNALQLIAASAVAVPVEVRY